MASDDEYRAKQSWWSSLSHSAFGGGVRFVMDAIVLHTIELCNTTTAGREGGRDTGTALASKPHETSEAVPRTDAFAAQGVRPAPAAPRPGPRDRPRHGRAGHAGHHAHGGRQVAVLPAAGAAPGRPHRRRVAADRADEGPGRAAGRRGRLGRAAAQCPAA